MRAPLSCGLTWADSRNTHHIWGKQIAHTVIERAFLPSLPSPSPQFQDKNIKIEKESTERSCAFKYDIQ